MATRRSRRGQPAEFEQDDEIERRFRENLAEARQTIDDVIPADSEQKREALEAVGELEEEVDDADGDREIELAAAAVALGGRHGPAVVAPLLDAYGMDQFDLRRLDTAQLLVSVAAQLGVDLGAVAGCG